MNRRNLFQAAAGAIVGALAAPFVAKTAEPIVIETERWSVKGCDFIDITTFNDKTTRMVARWIPQDRQWFITHWDGPSDSAESVTRCFQSG